MSTRCTLTIRDAYQALTIYRHSDGYPDSEHGVLATLVKAFPYAWPLPRFEADDFAAAIVAGWKESRRVHSSGHVSQGGNIRLLTGDRDSVGDSVYHYEITHAGHRNKIKVAVYARKYGDVDDGSADVWKLVKTRLIAQPVYPATTTATEES